MAAEPDPRVVDNPEQGRYELWLGATRAGFVDYLSEPGTLLLVHTEVDPAFEGQGLGGRLVADGRERHVEHHRDGELPSREIKQTQRCLLTTRRVASVA
jgi:predicted GNAT family acetyltransferase